MEAPRKIDAKTPTDYFEVLTKAVFQSGISWRVVEAKWDGLKEALAGLDPERVAALGPPDIDRLMEDSRVIRNRRKLEATVDNATELLAVADEYGDVRRYLRSHGGFDETAADLKRRFRFLGDLGAYYFLHVVGEEVPPHEEWRARREGRAKR